VSDIEREKEAGMWRPFLYFLPWMTIDVVQRQKGNAHVSLQRQPAKLLWHSVQGVNKAQALCF